MYFSETNSSGELYLKKKKKLTRDSLLYGFPATRLVFTNAAGQCAAGGLGRVAMLWGGWASRNPCRSQSLCTEGAGGCGSLGLPMRVQERCAQQAVFPARETHTHCMAIQAQRMKRIEGFQRNKGEVGSQLLLWKSPSCKAAVPGLLA